MKTAAIKSFYSHFCILIFLAFSFFGCQKDFTSNLPLDQPTDTSTNSNVDLTTKVMAKSISGFVTNENDIAVVGANVKVGTVTTLTDKYGFLK